MLSMSETIFPKGFYCYTPISFTIHPDKGWVYKIKPCPFYVHIDNLAGVCSAISAEVEDQVKLCGINEFTDEEIDEVIRDKYK